MAESMYTQPPSASWFAPLVGAGAATSTAADVWAAHVLNSLSPVGSSPRGFKACPYRPGT
jgi:hypothetical protein